MKIVLNSKPINFLRFGLQRKKDFLKDVKRAYDGLVLPANILLYQYKATPSLIHMCKDKLFFIDPMSYLFGQPYEEFKRLIDGRKEFKPSFEKLMEAHGLSVEHFLEFNYNDLLKHLSIKSNLKTFVDNCLDFQANTVSENLKKYTKDLIEEENFDGEEYKPAFLIPPYFLYEEDSITSKINLTILEYIKEKKQTFEFYPMFFIRREDLGSEFINDLLDKINSYEFPGYCLWVNNFRESSVVSSEEVSNIISLVSKLSKNSSKNVIMLYGGYFSLLLYHFGLTGICHGTLYSESRNIKDSVKKSSGPIQIRYYIKGLHDFFTINNAIDILGHYNDLMCQCLICKRLVKNNPNNIAYFSNEEAQAEMHFLFNRYQEKEEIASHNIENLAELLEFTSNTYKKINKLVRIVGEGEKQIADISYLNFWQQALKETLTQSSL